MILHGWVELVIFPLTFSSVVHTEPGWVSKVLQGLYSFQITESQGPQNGKASHSRTWANSTCVTEMRRNGSWFRLTTSEGPILSRTQGRWVVWGLRARPCFRNQKQAQGTNIFTPKTGSRRQDHQRRGTNLGAEGQSFSRSFKDHDPAQRSSEVQSHQILHSRGAGTYTS